MADRIQKYKQQFAAARQKQNAAQDAYLEALKDVQDAEYVLKAKKNALMDAVNCVTTIADIFIAEEF